MVSELASVLLKHLINIDLFWLHLSEEDWALIADVFGMQQVLFIYVACHIMICFVRKICLEVNNTKSYDKGEYTNCGIKQAVSWIFNVISLYRFSLTVGCANVWSLTDGDIYWSQYMATLSSGVPGITTHCMPNCTCGIMPNYWGFSLVMTRKYLYDNNGDYGFLMEAVDMVFISYQMKGVQGQWSKLIL